MTDDRVETRVTLVGRGIGATPESIDELRKRARQLEKLTRKKPTKHFGDLLGEAEEPGDSEPDLEPSSQSSPTPRPGLVHPSQRQAYGRDENSRETVVLKG